MMVFAAAQSGAQLITQPLPFSLTGTSSVTSVSFNQWNPTNGPLTSITLNIDGAVAGTFEVFNTVATDLTVSNARTQQTFSFLGPGAPSAIFTSTPMTLQTFPSTVPSYAVIDGFDSQIFVLTNNMPIALNGSYNLSSFASYFTGTGVVTLNVFSSFNISGNGPRTFDKSGLNTSGTVTLSMVPEPSTYALLGVSALALAFVARRRRP